MPSGTDIAAFNAAPTSTVATNIRLPVKTPQNPNHEQWRYFVSLSYPNEATAKMRENKSMIEYEPTQEERKLWDVRGLSLIFDHGRMHHKQGKDAFSFGTVRGSAFDNAGNLYTFNTFDRDLRNVGDGDGAKLVNVLCSFIDSGKIGSVSMRYDVVHDTDPETKEIIVKRRKMIENSLVSPNSKPVHESCRIFKNFHDLPIEVQQRLREQIIDDIPVDCLRRWNIVSPSEYDDLVSKGYRDRKACVYSEENMTQMTNCLFSGTDTIGDDEIAKALTECVNDAPATTSETSAQSRVALVELHPNSLAQIQEMFKATFVANSGQAQVQFSVPDQDKTQNPMDTSTTQASAPVQAPVSVPIAAPVQTSAPVSAPVQTSAPVSAPVQPSASTQPSQLPADVVAKLARLAELEDKKTSAERETAIRADIEKRVRDEAEKNVRDEFEKKYAGIQAAEAEKLKAAKAEIALRNETEIQNEITTLRAAAMPTLIAQAKAAAAAGTSDADIEKIAAERFAALEKRVRGPYVGDNVSEMKAADLKEVRETAAVFSTSLAQQYPAQSQVVAAFSTTTTSAPVQRSNPVNYAAGNDLVARTQSQSQAKNKLPEVVNPSRQTQLGLSEQMILEEIMSGATESQACFSMHGNVVRATSTERLPPSFFDREEFNDGRPEMLKQVAAVLQPQGVTESPASYMMRTKFGMAVLEGTRGFRPGEVRNVFDSKTNAMVFSRQQADKNASSGVLPVSEQLLAM